MGTAHGPLRIERAAPGDRRVDALIERHLDLMRSVTPPESVFAQDSAGLARDGARLFVAFRGGETMGIGAYKLIAPDHAEIKSMHVVEEARGLGAGAALLEKILAEAKAEGASRASLETGSAPAFQPALRLYERAGFASCAAFGPYPDNPFSRFMTRTL